MDRTPMLRVVKARLYGLTNLIWQARSIGMLRTGFDSAAAWEEVNGQVKDLPGFTKHDADFYLLIRAGVDVKGKIVMVLKGTPRNVSNTVWEKVATEREVFGRLIERGAAGIVLVYQGEKLRFPMIAAFLSNRRVSLAEPVPNLTSSARWSIELLADKFDLPPSVLISKGTAEKIFETRRLQYMRVKHRAELGEYVSCDLKVQAAISPHFKAEAGISDNVLGVIEDWNAAY